MAALFRRWKKRVSRGRFAAGLLFFAVAAVGGLCLDLYLMRALHSEGSLPVRAVLIDGDLQHVSRQEVAAVAGPLCAGRNIAVLDTTPLQEALLQLPWIARVQVRKKMPDVLIISLVEHVPAACWNDHGLYDAVNQVVFYPDMQQFAEPLVRLGAERDELAPEVYARAVMFMRQLAAYNLTMTEVTLDQIRCFRIRLQNGTQLILGRDNEKQVVLRRLQRFLQAQAGGEFDLNSAEYVDLRYDTGFAVMQRSNKQE